MYDLWVPISYLMEYIQKECPWPTCDGMDIDDMVEYIANAIPTEEYYNPCESDKYGVEYHAARIKFFMQDDLDIEPIHLDDGEGLCDGYHRLFGRYLAGDEYIECEFVCCDTFLIEFLGLNSQEELEVYVKSYAGNNN